MIDNSNTISDYESLPDDRRVELIDGVFYDMASPTTIHQIIALSIWGALKQFIAAHHGGCIPFAAPTDVQLDCDEKTIVQPDVMLVCDRSKINKKRIYGAPDFIVEVLSPSSRSKDILYKAFKYQRAGVREYWMVDPDRKTIVKHVYDHDDVDVQNYTFSEQVPVSILAEGCVVDFSEILNEISFIET